MKAFHNFVDGAAVDALDGATVAVVNPATGEQYGTAPNSGAADVDAAMRAAAAAFPGWRDTTPSQRSLALLRIADALESRAEELIAVEVEKATSRIRHARAVIGRPGGAALRRRGGDEACQQQRNVSPVHGRCPRDSYATGGRSVHGSSAPQPRAVPP